MFLRLTVDTRDGLRILLSSKTSPKQSALGAVELLRLGGASSTSAYLHIERADELDGEDMPYGIAISRFKHIQDVSSPGPDDVLSVTRFAFTDRLSSTSDRLLFNCPLNYVVSSAPTVHHSALAPRPIDHDCCQK
ncbi:hypothetical protein ECG_01795 [Echinococcus granulosus]|uniref:Uncharacterized protein n=1 Tax=Echinococcus granulosus TaxID=6210 RepID=A0A068WCF0_ECHGR|nr:hypothetical protein ECG_01795 [Echinococcus granulosus]CDS15261.1 hypothetical protein EgrG_002015500 [Echinococcus granulosus]